MIGRLFFDTNLLIYAIDPANPEKRARAAALLRGAVETGRLVVSPQTLNECYRVLTIKHKLVSSDAGRAFLRELLPFCIAPLDAGTTQLAFVIEDRLRASWWDCVMLASALQAGCQLFLSEDLQGEREIEGMRIVSPFTRGFDLNILLSRK
jgi:predicted nucleic acid-binding protein